MVSTLPAFRLQTRDEADSVKGVAPDAQLLAMKVFSNNGSIKGCYDDDLIAAIEDSVKLGVKRDQHESWVRQFKRRWRS